MAAATSNANLVLFLLPGAVFGVSMAATIMVGQGIGARDLGQHAALAPLPLMQARLVDTVIGAVPGLAGAACLHRPGFRARVGAGLRRLIPGT